MACDTSPRDAGWSNSAIRLVDSLRVQESDSALVSRPSYITPVEGGFLVSDAFSGRVILIDSKGVQGRWFGRKGRGPGELLAPITTAVLGDTLVVADDAQRLLVLYRRSTGKHIVSFPSRGIVRSARVAGDTIWFGALNMTAATGVWRWTPSDSAGQLFGAVPRAYTQSAPLAGLNSRVSVAQWGDTLMVGFSASDSVYFYSTNGSRLGQSTLPVARRRGIPSGLVRLMERRANDIEAAFALHSALFTLEHLPGGSLVAIHYDQTTRKKLITATVFLTVLKTDGSHCVDLQVPVKGDVQPVVAFQGDTLLALEQYLVGDEVATVLRRYVLDAEKCVEHT